VKKEKPHPGNSSMKKNRTVLLGGNTKDDAGGETDKETRKTKMSGKKRTKDGGPRH